MESITASLTIGLLTTAGQCNTFVLTDVLTMVLALGGMIALLFGTNWGGAFIHRSHCRGDNHHFWDQAAVQH